MNTKELDYMILDEHLVVQAYNDICNDLRKTKTKEEITMDFREELISKLKKMRKRVCGAIDEFIKNTKEFNKKYTKTHSKKDTPEKYNLTRVCIRIMDKDLFNAFSKTLTYGYHLRKGLFTTTVQHFSITSLLTEYWLDFYFGMHDYETTMKVVDGLIKAFKWGNYAFDSEYNNIIVVLYANYIGDGTERLCSYKMNDHECSDEFINIMSDLWYEDKVGTDYNKWFFTVNE